MGWGGWFFSDYHVSPNFLLCLVVVGVVVEVGLGCENFRKKGLPKLTFRKGRYFPLILSFSNFFHFHNQSQVFTTTGQKYDRYMTTSKKIRPLAQKCAKLERFIELLF